MIKGWNGVGAETMTDSEIEMLFQDTVIRECQPLSGGVPSTFVQANLHTGYGVREVTDKNGDLVPDFRNDCFQQEEFTFDAIRLRRNASEMARRVFDEYARRFADGLAVKLVA